MRSKLLRLFSSAAMTAFLLIALVSPARAGIALTPQEHGYITEYALGAQSLEPWSIDVDDAGMVWFTLDRVREIGRLDPKTGIFTRYPAPGALPYHLKERDGFIWYTDFEFSAKEQPGRIIRFNPETGEHKAFPLPDPKAGPAILGFDPTGNLWVTEILAGRVGRLDPTTGTYEVAWEPPVSDVVDRQRFPYGHTFDGMGRLWLAEAGPSRLLRITPAGDFKAFNMPDGFWGPTIPIVGPDEQIWLSAHGAGSIASIDPETGVTKVWPTHEPDEGFPISRPSDMRVGKNGEIWVMEHEGNRLARIFPRAGTIVEYPLPHQGELSEWIDLDRDGNVWYAGRATGHIGRMRADAPYYLVQAQMSANRVTTGGRLSGSLTVSAHGNAPSDYSFELALAPGGMSATFESDGRFVISVDPRKTDPGEYQVLLGIRTSALLASTPVTIIVEEPRRIWLEPQVVVPFTLLLGALLFLLVRRRRGRRSE